MDRREAELACAEIQNLVPRDLVEQMRYRRQVVHWMFTHRDLPPTEIGVISSAEDVYPYQVPGRGLAETAEVKAERWGIKASEEGDSRIPEDYALVEWLAPEGRCADYGVVERHGEHQVESFDGHWAFTDVDESKAVNEAAKP